MQKAIWYGIKNDSVRLFAQDPSANQNVSGVGQCTLISDNGNLDVEFPDGGSLFSTGDNDEQVQTQTTSQQTS